MTPDPERRLVLAYAPAAARAGLAALLALDDALAAVVRTTSEPALGQIRLAWWREALERLDTAPAPAEPVLRGLAATVLPAGVAGARLAAIVHGWEVLVEAPELDADALRRYAEGRGVLFALAGDVLGAGPGDPLDAAGQGWALADLARNLRDSTETDSISLRAKGLLEGAASVRWSRNGRALGAILHLSRSNLTVPRGMVPPVGSPARVGRLLWHRLTGR